MLICILAKGGCDVSNSETDFDVLNPIESKASPTKKRIIVVYSHLVHSFRIIYLRTFRTVTNLHFFSDDNKLNYQFLSYLWKEKYKDLVTFLECTDQIVSE